MKIADRHSLLINSPTAWCQTHYAAPWSKNRPMMEDLVNKPPSPSCIKIFIHFHTYNALSRLSSQTVVNTPQLPSLTHYSNQDVLAIVRDSSFAQNYRILVAVNWLKEADILAPTQFSRQDQRMPHVGRMKARPSLETRSTKGIFSSVAAISVC